MEPEDFLAAHAAYKDHAVNLSKMGMGITVPTAFSSSAPAGARSAVVRALVDSVVRFPRLAADPAVFTGLSPQEAPLAMAIHRTVLRRWLTLEHLLNRSLRRPVAALEPSLRAVLLSGAAQLLFMDALPAYAVVDESVKIARHLIRPGAAGLVNAVLRRISGCVSPDTPNTPDTEGPRRCRWSPAADLLPVEGGAMKFREAWLPDPRSLDQHLSIATSHPLGLVRGWLDQLGQERTLEICRHGVLTPPTIVATEAASIDTLRGGEKGWMRPHRVAGFVVWEGPRGQLETFLKGHPARRVQDPASAIPAAATAGLEPRLIIDYCAGRGTKTRQLASLHPGAQIIALEVSAGRRVDLIRTAKGIEGRSVKVVAARQQINDATRADLIVLDVPCSNTAVLSRRPEARYRFDRASRDSLIKLQRQIVGEAIDHLTDGGHLLYSTCSLEPVENQHQVDWMLGRYPLHVIASSTTYPEGEGVTFQDGGFYALLRKAGE